MDMNRRKLIGGIGLLIAAPAIVKVSNIMRVKAQEPWPDPHVLVYTHRGFHTVNLPTNNAGFKVGDYIVLHRGCMPVEGVIVSAKANLMRFEPTPAVYTFTGTGWKRDA
jgi:hypothetical protein